MTWRPFLAGAALATCCGALALPGDTPAPSSASGPFLLPTIDGQERTHAPPAGTLKAAKLPDPRTLFDMAVACWPAPSYLRAELSLEGRANARNGNRTAGTTQTTSIDPQTGGITQSIAGNESYVGVVAKIPLYSAMELDKEREREANRRAKVAEAVGLLAASIAEWELNQRELALNRALEKRSQERIALGVAETSEQVALLRAVAQLEGKSFQVRAHIIKARLTVVGLCEDGPRADTVDSYIREFTRHIEP